MRNKSQMSDMVGIDHIAAYVPNQYLPLEELAKARNVEPSKFLVGIGIREMAVSSPWEDVVVLAANAGYAVLKEAGISPKDIGLLIVGTESAVDLAKPTAIHVHELLDTSSSCRVYDTTHACVGATYGVLSAIDWIRGSSSSKYALVIASDIVKYGKDTPGEPTQGAGAVAILVSRAPRLMALEEISTYSKNVYDFWKPLSLEYPVINGRYSAECYQEAALECFKALQIDKNAAFIYHTPYPKLVKQTHARVVRMLCENLDWMRHYEEKVSSSIIYAARIGNIYTGSLWLALISFLENYYDSAKELPAVGDKVKNEYDSCYLFSYGSGCSAVLIHA